jgi:hypothetical protein
MFEGVTKILGQKKQKKIFPRVPATRHSGKRPFSARDKALGEEVTFPEC